MKAILRKDGCLAAINERPVDFAYDIKWNEMDGNAMENFHLALADELTSLSCKIGEQERAELLLQSLPDSYDQLIINLTNSNVTSLVFDDVAAVVLQEENRRKHKEDRQVNLQQAKALTTMRGRSTERGQSISHKHGRSKSRSKKNLKCYHCGKKGHLKKDYWSLNKNSNPQGNTATLQMMEMFYAGETLVEAEASVASCSSDSAMLWHQKLGHMSEQGMKVLVEQKLLSGLTKIKCFRTDNGGEYTSEEFDDFCRKEGIKRQFTVANTPQQNGVAERMNRTLLERTRAMLRDAGLEKSFRAEAVNTACYLVNRAPSTAIELKTPMEMWTGKPADYSNLHIFGSIVYVMYNSQEISKLDPKSRKCKFLGYADGVKGYRLWDPTAIHVEKEFEEGDSSEAEPAHDEQEPDNYEAPTTRQSYRVRRRPNWHSDYVIEGNIAYCLLTEDGEPSTYQEAINSSDASLWMMAMQEEIEAFIKIIHGPCATTTRNEANWLNKSLYGLKQAPRCWYKRFDSFIMCLGYNRLNADPCAYFKSMSPSSEERMEMSRVPYASAVGSLMFAMICTRPDMHKQWEWLVGTWRIHAKHWNIVKRILRYIKGTSNVALCYGGSNLLIGYVDSDYAGDLDKSKSTTGYVFKVAGGAVSWFSKLQSVVATSTTEAEYVAATQASKEAIWLKMLLEELGHNQSSLCFVTVKAPCISRNPSFHSGLSTYITILLYPIAVFRNKKYVRNRHRMKWEHANACVSVVATTTAMASGNRRRKTKDAMWESDHAVCSAMILVVTKIVQLNTPLGKALAWMLAVYRVDTNAFAILIVEDKAYLPFVLRTGKEYARNRHPSEVETCKCLYECGGGSGDNGIGNSSPENENMQHGNRSMRGGVQ
ncbi:hypothetical protein F3Y22_tig00116954pilonHSYRG00091 [Hibiscus syriacus]|uniref:Integrase catalytic domain-containing protein n=1 Tax=Hibiscus syriacus TaxID=106335 RepID=A0A6A2WYQ4_HIBSY|nr:hypothetical protein F3Y22_tig00116954pilonHSYRG00091 [Hibiscus syriacus]